MKFSIVTPVFNGMPQLRSCIGSVRGQILPQAEMLVDREPSETQQPKDLTTERAIRVQHIIQDGGSTDGGGEFLQGYMAQQPSTNNYQPSFVSEADAGMYDAINRAWAKADGDILSWLNADEQYLPGTLGKVAAYFERHPDVDAVFGNTIITTADGSPYAARREIPLRKAYVANGFLYALSCSTFFRRRLWDDGLLKLDTQYRYSADADLVLRLLENGIRFGHVDDFFALFGVEEGKNLSFRPEMKVEGDAIKQKYGALPWAPARKAVMVCRYAERFVRGCYRPVPVKYAYCLDEAGSFMEFEHPALGFRFTYAGFKTEEAHDA